MAYIDETGFAFIWGQIKSLFQAKELKTGSQSTYKELTDNNLTDTLKSNYDSAYTLTSSITASASEINQLDGITLGTAAAGTVSTSGVSNNSTNLVTEAQVKTYVDANAGGASDIIEGYYNSTDGKFYETRSGSEGSYTYSTEITGTAEKLYIDLESNELYRYDTSAFEKCSAGSLVALTTSEITTIINNAS